MKTNSLRFLLLLPPAVSAAHPAHESLPSVDWTGDAPQVSITVEGEFRIIRANGIPDHPTGRFPGRGNPNRIAPQRHEFRVPLLPKAAQAPSPLGMRDRKSTRLNSSHVSESRMPSSA